jgi:Uma2 family endonuclease
VTAEPVQYRIALPMHLLTIAEYAALPEDDAYRRLELQEGRLVMSPSAKPDHMIVSGELYGQLKPQLPDDVYVIYEVDVDLQLTPPDGPGTVRQPDLIVVDRAEVERVHAEDGILRASAVRLVIEILSPGSRRTDFVVKHAEYADAGIPHYWILDLQPPISIAPFHLGGELGYVAEPEATGIFRTEVPFPLHVELDALH